MELNNEFHVSVPIDVAWAVLTDLERVAPCMPGAELQEVEGDEYRGVVKVKVGPITAQYKGTAKFVEKDDGQHRAVLLAEGRDTRGQGNASATVTAVAIPDDDGTTVSIATELTITGKVAQFGRSVMADVSAKMLGEFADRLEADVLSQGSGPQPRAEPGEPKAEPGEPKEPTAQKQRSEPADQPAGENTATAEGSDPPSVRTIHSTPAEPVDLLGTAGPSILKRVAPVAALVSVLLLLWRRRRRRHSSQ
jgi:carbon monoxide dehydrogenase subunit G